MTSFEFNQAGIDALLAQVHNRVDAAAGEHPIPRNSSVSEIERILTEQIIDSGAAPNPAAVKLKAAEIYKGFQEGSL